MISVEKPLGPLALLILSAWCGLVAGLLEVTTIVVRKTAFDSNHLYDVTHHFVWLIPVINLGLFVAVGLLGLAACWAWPRAGRWAVARALCALALLPAFLIAFPRIYSLGWLAATLGMAARIVPILEAHRGMFARVVKVSMPIGLGIVAVLATAPSVGEKLSLWREAARPLPPLGSPNVILIVLDTVAAGHLSLYGYERPTSTSLVDLAERGVRFDSARAPSSWTLPSHASMFTGRWMHELSVGWLNPLDDAQPTLAEHLGAKGYATAASWPTRCFAGGRAG